MEGHDYYLEEVQSFQWDDFVLSNAVASRWPITSSEKHYLPRSDEPDIRAALCVSIGAPFGSIGFIVTHLHWKPTGSQLRVTQARELCALIEKEKDRHAFPPILVGDFNAVPDSDEIRLIKGLPAPKGKSYPLLDAWEVAGDPKTAGATFSNRNAYLQKESSPDRRFDYIFVGSATPDGLGKVETCRVVCDQEQAGVWPSDHFGVYAELRIDPFTAPTATTVR